MAATKTKQLKKIINDAELREHALNALHSVQQAVEEAQGTEKQISKRAEKKLKKTQKKVSKAEAKIQDSAPVAAVADKVEDAKDAAKPKKKRHPVRKLVVLGTIGAIVALVISEDARKVVLDALFGAEEEFEYTSSTTAAGASTNGAS